MLRNNVPATVARSPEIRAGGGLRKSVPGLGALNSGNLRINRHFRKLSSRGAQQRSDPGLRPKPAMVPDGFPRRQGSRSQRPQRNLWMDHQT